MRLLVGLSFIIFSIGATAAEPISALKPLAPFIGTWTSISGSVDGSEKFEDVAKWEWAFKGQVVRITHSVNQGAYAGESLIHWDDTAGKIIYRYVNTAGFYTDGTIIPKSDGSIDVHEYVRESKSGPTESLSNYRLENGQIKAWSKFKKDGEWAEPRHITYKATPDAAVITNY